MENNSIVSKNNDLAKVNGQQKTYLISVRGEDYDSIMLNDIKYRSVETPARVAEHFIRVNRVVNATVYVSEMRNCYKIGNLIYTDKSLAEKNSDIYGLDYEKFVEINTLEVRQV